MASRHRRRNLDRPMEPFTEAAPNDAPWYLDRIRKHSGFDNPAAADDAIREHLATKIFTNNRYAVFVRTFIARDGRKMMHLSIKHNDRSVIDDWRDLQRIKNIFAGPDVDAVQVFPRESRLVDTSNQYHLWCFMDGAPLPYGYEERNVVDVNDSTFTGIRQRRIAEQPDEIGHHRKAALEFLKKKNN